MFGYNPKYPPEYRIKTVKYLPQPYESHVPLYNRLFEHTSLIKQNAQEEIYGANHLEECKSETTPMISVGETVIHKVFGKGVITETDKTRITVRFSTESKMFLYPDVIKQGLLKIENAPSQNFLESLPLNGDGVPRDYEETIKRWQREAEQGHVEAQFNLGIMYHNGNGVPQESQEAA